MDLGLADARVLVVGGSRGMGRAAAETFAREGARVAVLARASEALDDTVATLDSEGTYFLCVDLAASGVNLDDEAFCRRAVEDHGVAAIPVSAFYEMEAVTSVARLCFSKRDETLDQGIRRLAKAREASAKA